MKPSALGEIAVMKYFAQLGYNVYSAITENAKVDLVVEKDGVFERVEVKSTSARYKDKYKVQLKRVRSNKNQNKVINFDPSSIDLLAVYIIPEDKVVVIKSSDISAKTEMIIGV